jgi:hypothetical protein
MPVDKTVTNMTVEDNLTTVRSKYGSVFHRNLPKMEVAPLRGAMIAGKCLDPYTASEKFFSLPKTI